MLPRAALLASLLCRAAAAPAPPPPLSWRAPAFKPLEPLAGLAPLPNASTSIIFFGTPQEGDYNHGAMLHYSNGLLTAAWKNGVGTAGEDKPGQRVRYSQSSDGATWTPSALLFPSLSTAALPVALFAGPFAVLNGRLYASATPAVIATGDAQGSQFCLWPDGVDPRNAGPPGQRQPVGVLLLRRVLGLGLLGPVFWAADAVPEGFAPASAAAGLLTANQTDAQTRADAALLRADLPQLPCGDPASSGTLKCEAVARGAQEYERLPAAARLANERSHWVVPAGTAAWGGADVLVYRSHSSALWASARLPGAAEWSEVALSPIPNDDSNVNAGALPDGRVFLAANAVPHRGRNPLTLALSSDGLAFSQVRWVMSCTAMPYANSSCVARGPGGSSGGPSYPQALSVVAPAPLELQGFYVIVRRALFWGKKSGAPPRPPRASCSRPPGSPHPAHALAGHQQQGGRGGGALPLERL